MRFKAAAFAVVVAVVGLALDLVMDRLLHNFWRAEIAGNVCTGMIAGYFMFRYMHYRHQLSHQRAAQIAYLNHHIRNAMEAIVLSHYTGDDVQRLKLMREASDRIQYTLKRFTADDSVSLETSEELGDQPPTGSKKV